MKIIFIILGLICFESKIYSQAPPQETFGNPIVSTPISSYTGWVNQNITYNGSAEVQNLNPSNYKYASGGGNIFFTNTIGTELTVSGFNMDTPDWRTWNLFS